ncbi:uncharacterized protein LOC130206630 [Pseudoliparis swirei]|uniref:uncharacterized protein LOC130206630 n=1 Tax=Pseudoliparis swirei TaxID=2059687 RepID=UPI0024BE9CD9|nr:uncharacterized protein LOC130206630 [Pseudoliparis swirei]
MTTSQEDKAQVTLETRSHVSSRSSASTAISNAATKARARAEASKVKFAYAEKEAVMLREKACIEEQKQKVLAEATRRQAELEADLHTLQLEKEAEAASREADVYQAAAEWEDNQLLDTGDENRAQRTREYVQNTPVQHAPQPLLTSQQTHREPSRPLQATAQLHMLQPQHPAQLFPQATNHPQLSGADYAGLHDDSTSSRHPIIPSSHTANLPLPRGADYVGPNNIPTPSRYPLAPPSHATSDHYTGAPPPMPDFSTYLIRKEMVSSGLTQFDDRPENYWAWKTSFQSITQDLNLTHREELDLLVKWLGPESATHAKRIRSVHVTSPDKAVETIWQRLEDCYGCPEVIEHALMKRLEDFPRVSNKDPRQLRELGDLLQELESAKWSGLTPGLAYLDSARGVKPIVEKLPYGLQEKWVTQGSRYKEEFKVSFPPFSFFVKFICNQAKTRNDPSFFFSSSNDSNSMKTDRAVNVSNKPSVFVKKTEVSAGTRNFPSSQADKQNNEPDKYCAIHNKPHPLFKCRAFRIKHLDDRKAYLRENYICYHCCASTKHVAKDCKLSVKCRECGSDKHVSALHPGPAPWSSEETKSEPEQSEQQLDVTTKCTKICVASSQPRSCSKVCLVKVYPSKHRERAQHVYAILDEQSNRSLAKTQFFDLFRIGGDSSPYTLRTCSGTVETAGRKACSFTVESLDGKSTVALPPLIECNTIQDDKSEIPTADITRHFAHLSPVRDKIPPLDPDAQILLLLGRDVLSVHKHLIGGNMSGQIRIQPTTAPDPCLQLTCSSQTGSLDLRSCNSQMQQKTVWWSISSSKAQIWTWRFDPK